MQNAVDNLAEEEERCKTYAGKTAALAQRGEGEYYQTVGKNDDQRVHHNGAGYPIVLPQEIKIGMKSDGENKKQQSRNQRGQRQEHRHEAEFSDDIVFPGYGF